VSPDLHEFVDGMGLVFSEVGGSRMMGRIIGFLLVCDPPHQSEPQLCARLAASKGAVNTITRQLVRNGMLERVVIPGERATFLRIRGDAWSHMLRQRFVVVHTMQRMARDGLETLAGAPDERRARLQQFHDFYDFMAREIEPLIARFEGEGQ
jgi:DNA-binding transcriptional regulator GbsR (MarR family)